NRLDVRIASAHGGNDCPRYIGDDNANGADGDVDRTWYSIFVAVRFPPQCELPSSTARSKSATSRLSWSSASEIARVTTRRGNPTFAASAHAVRAPAIKVSLPASLGPTISTKRPGPMRFVGVVGGEVRVVMRGDFRHTTRCAQQLHHRPDGHEWDRRI